MNPETVQQRLERYEDALVYLTAPDHANHAFAVAILVLGGDAADVAIAKAPTFKIKE